ncbi:hypothetical protein QLQ12_37165 [Actinoplanes sp. NEAU-A12]|uniref:Lipoprotein n=1 Tax=Actinoplanes sandaracinus TaxID=3045177 RepID=A0ABT6WWX3_9ACTN|nr:hypothetical protein [Actinoplanes sandaracinus]MDI6104237.1 hypothetical protein [Actinoplanes sandaracinus]
MQKSHTSVVLAVLLLAATAGCQSGGEASPSPSLSAPAASVPASTEAGTAPASPAAASSPAASAAAEKAFPLAVSRRGGFAGVDDHVSITADGTAVVTRRGGPAVRTSLPAATMDELRLLLAAPEFAGRTTPPDAPVCNDGFEYELVSPSSTTRVHDCGGGHGTAVDRVLAIVAQLFNS